MKKVTLHVLVLLALTLAASLVLAEADWVEKKWHGPGGVVYLHIKGHLITSWNGNSYFPTATTSDANWVQAKWHGPGGVIYLHTRGHLVTSWSGDSYFPMN